MAAPSDRPNSPSPEVKDLSEAKDEGLTFGAVLGATIGNMLEFYDFVTYSFFATQIGHAFFPTKSEFASLLLSLATFGAGFVTRPIGAIVIGSYSDRAGRRPAMLLSFAMMGVAILVLAITPSYNTIGVAAPIVVILARLTQGFSLGGEVGPTTAYLMEAAPVQRRGLVVSLQPVSQQIAATAGALVGEILSLTMQPMRWIRMAGASLFCSAPVRCRSDYGCAAACLKRCTGLKRRR
jgi:MFS family permease